MSDCGGEEFRLRRAETIPLRTYTDCHGGCGPVHARLLLTEGDAAFSRLRLLHDDILPPGAEIGLHGHPDGCGEFYYILGGAGELDSGLGWEPVRAGDLGYAPPGTRHAIRNHSPADLHVLVIGTLSRQGD